MKKHARRSRGALYITLVYLCFSALWIFLSDSILLHLTMNIEVIALVSKIKGFIFVTLSALLIYLLTRRKIAEKNLIIIDLDREVELRAQLISELHHRIKNNLQIVISLVNLESESKRDRKAFIHSLNEKLHSMISVFNVVYNFNDMRNIALDRVLDEYIKNTNTDLVRIESPHSPSLSIETITSLMLVIESVISIWCKNESSMESLQISISEVDCVSLYCCSFSNDTAVREEDRVFLDLELAAIEGSLNLDPESGRAEIHFNAE